MKRDLTELTRETFDVLIVGAGIYGACAAQEAVLRGLSVALIDKSDFGAATSANSLKIIHGGLRYLQQADFVRMRESIRERCTMLRIAPHLVHPMPVTVPTYGHGMKGKELMSIALAMNDIISLDRNRLPDPEKHIPAGRTISRRECLRLFPGVREDGLTGAVIFCDAQVYNSERLTLAFVRAAEHAGAVVANYVEATSFLQTDGRVSGVHARDVLTRDTFDIRAKVVINMAGPWAGRLLTGLGRAAARPTRLAKAINVVTRPLFEQYAVGVSGRASYRDHDVLINKGSRLFFIAPWRGYSLVGTAYSPCDDDPDSFTVTTDDISTFLGEVNDACPGAKLTLSDILFVHKGLLPMSGVHPNTGDVQLTHHYRIEDERSGGIPGLITVVGVKYTTARDVAQRAVDRVFQQWGQAAPLSRSAQTPVYGGHIERFDNFLRDEIKQRPCELKDISLRRLIYNYGSAYREVLDYLDIAQPRALAEDVAVLRAQVRHSVHNEMAQKLSDVIFRRTELGTAGNPGREVLEFSANVIATELGWSQSRVQQELHEVIRAFDLPAPSKPEPGTVPDTESRSLEQTDGTKLADKAVQ